MWVRGVAQVVHQQLGLVVIEVGILLAVTGAVFDDATEQQQVVAMAHDLTNLTNDEGCNGLGVIDVAGIQSLDAEFVVLVVALTQVDTLYHVVAEAIDGADIGSNFKDAQQRGFFQVLEIHQGHVGVGEVGNHTTFLLRFTQLKDDGSLDGTFGVNHGADVFKNVLLGVVFGVVVLAEVPLHDADGALVLVPPPSVSIFAAGVVAHRNRQEVGRTHGVLANHLVSLVEVPVDLGVDPLGAFDFHTFALNETDLAEVANVDEAYSEVGSNAVCAKTFTSGGVVAANCEQELAVFYEAEQVDVATESVDFAHDAEV